MSLKTIKSKIKANNKVKICLSVDSLRKIISNNQNKTIKLYVDEFMYSHAFCRQFLELLEAYPELIKTGYFSSSINSLQNSVIFKELKKLNNNKTLTMLTTDYII